MICSSSAASAWCVSPTFPMLFNFYCDGWCMAIHSEFSLKKCPAIKDELKVVTSLQYICCIPRILQITMYMYITSSKVQSVGSFSDTESKNCLISWFLCRFLLGLTLEKGFPLENVSSFTVLSFFSRLKTVLFKKRVFIERGLKREMDRRERWGELLHGWVFGLNCFKTRIINPLPHHRISSRQPNIAHVHIPPWIYSNNTDDES